MDTPPVRIEELLAHAGWVRSLASRLVRDPAAADDVAQEVWASALRSPPRERTNLRAWLSSAVRSAARSTKRGEDRRKGREAAASPAREELDPAGFVERAELHRELVHHVLALPEPLRSLVLARWFDGLSVAQAARRLGLTARVAQLRLDEAHEVLRRRLDQRHGGRAAWSVAYLGWVRTEAMAASAAGAFSAGGFVVAGKVALASVVLATLAIAVWWRDDSANRPSDDLAVAAEVEGVPERRVVGIESSANEEQREAVATHPQGFPGPVAVAAQPRWLARGRVSGRGAIQWERTELSAELIGRWNFGTRRNATASEDGRYELDLTAMVGQPNAPGAPGEISITATHPACLIHTVKVPFASAELDAADPTGATRVFHVDFTLTSAAVITGRVIVPADWTPTTNVRTQRPPLAWVSLFEPAPASPDPVKVDTVNCDSDGRFTLRANHGGAFQLVATATGLQAEALQVDAVLGTTVALAPIELEPGAFISGTVLKRGRPIGAGVEVCAEPKLDRNQHVARFGSGWEALVTVQDRLAFVHLIARTDAEGRYRLEGLEAVEYELYVGTQPDVSAGFGRRPHVERTVKAPRSGVDLSLLEPLVRFSCTLEGRAANRMELGAEELTIVPLPAGRDPSLSVWLANAPAAIAVVQDVDYEFRIAAGRFEPVSLFVPALAFSEERDLLIDLKPRAAPSRLVLRLATRAEDAIEAAQIMVVDPRAAPAESPRWKPIAPEQDGTFSLNDLPAGLQRLRLLPFGVLGSPLSSTPYMGTEFSIDLPPGKSVEHVVRLEVGARLRLGAVDERGGYLRAAVDLRDASGAKLTTDFTCRTADAHYLCGGYLCEQGVNDHSPLPAGHYVLTLTADGFEDAVRSFELVAGETTQIAVAMRRR